MSLTPGNMESVFNLNSLIDNAVAKHGQRMALICGETRRSYAELEPGGQASRRPAGPRP